MKKRCTSKKLNVVKIMPPMYHTIPGKEFNVMTSEVVYWLVHQPHILNYLWDQIKNSQYVKYDPETGKWQGVDYGND